MAPNPTAAEHGPDDLEGPTRHGSPGGSSSTSSTGNWGERNAGPVNPRAAMAEFDELQREFSHRSDALSRHSGVFPTISRRSAARASQTAEHDEKTDSEDDDDDDDDDDDTFHLEQFMREGHFERRTEEGEAAKKMGVVFKNVTVRGVGSTAAVVKTLPQAIVGTFGPDLYRLVCRWVPWLRVRRKAAPLRTLLHDFTGVVQHGEMLLVLGRPGSGCSTFLRVLANQRGGYAAVEGEVLYGGMPAAEVARRYRGEVVYNMEDDQHMASLTVWQTLRFALLHKTRQHFRGEVELITNALLRMFGIAHTRDTPVGSAYVRGVSGGERKRVSIAEALATRSSVACWDNATRGLDAATALAYARSLRILTDVSDRTTATTLYQAGEEIYRLMDKVLVIDSGRMLYQGPASAARAYFEGLGFYAPPQQTTPDFLTSLCDPVTRQFHPGCAASCPKTAEALEQAFRASAAYRQVLDEVAAVEARWQATDHADRRAFESSVEAHKSKTVSAGSSYTVSFWKQVEACTRRELWLVWGDRTSLYTKFFVVLGSGFVVSSLFYNTPESTQGAFLRGGVVFFSIVFLGWLQLSELIKAVAGRDIIARHRNFAFYRPSAVSVARVLADLPLLALQVVVFGLIMYFLTGLDVDAGKFFIYLLFIYVTAFCVTALYRMFAALSPTIDDAVRFSGVALNLLIIFTGYVVAKPILLDDTIWFGWLYYVNPLAYAYEGALTNEFHGRTLTCAPGQLVPSGPGIGPDHQGCAIAGALPGQAGVSGDVYMQAQFQYSRSHLWRNFGIVIAFAVAYITVTVAATELLTFATTGGGALVFKSKPATQPKTGDEESGSEPPSDAAHTEGSPPDKALQLQASQSVFTWEDLRYTVATPQGPKQLLNHVRGYARPGVMVALMGASGAGKTTLLQTLSQRQTVGVVAGDMLVDGRPPGVEFRRGTGFVEQMDLHDETATVREALTFSALLRQSRDTPRADKLAYVDTILDLLELQPLQDAIVGSLGVEPKKRLTIGVELAAKPSLLLFLDEPTSGLDAQAAASIVRFLRKLCAAGQAIVCTIHQPSANLLQQFDQILALNPGGNVFYFGPVGPEGRTVTRYFAERGAVCPPGKNPAEFILETAASSRGVDWNQAWLDSAEHRALTQEIARLKAERLAAVPVSASASASVTETVFAAPTTVQIGALTQRMFRHQWRSPSYVYGMFFTAVLMGIVNGFTFWQLGHSLADLQNRMFSVFLIVMIPPTVLNAVLPKFFQHRMLWEAREHPARIYGWVAFCTASVLAEIPHSIVSATAYWLAWYYAAGLPRDSATAGYVFFITLLFFLFQSSWGQWICAFAPSFTVIANILPFFLVVFSIFNGVVVPYPQLNVFWKYWLYYLNPSTYWVRGTLSATLAGLPVVCAPEGEAARFDPPLGQTCADFASAFVRQAGRGYLMNPNDTTACGYCPYATGDEYLASLHIATGQKWRDLGIFLAFCVSNWALVYFFIYTVRVKGWSFGISSVLRTVSKIVSAVGGVFRKRK